MWNRNISVRACVPKLSQPITAHGRGRRGLRSRKKRADILKVRLGDGCGRTRTLVTCNDCTLSIQHASSLRESSRTKKTWQHKIQIMKIIPINYHIKQHRFDLATLREKVLLLKRKQGCGFRTWDKEQLLTIKKQTEARTQNPIWKSPPLSFSRFLSLRAADGSESSKNVRSP